MMKFIWLGLVIIGFTSACEDKVCCDLPPAEFNYSFDIRQCGTDLFTNDVDESADKSQRIRAMEIWLGINGINLGNVELTIGFHQNVCEACNSCPQGDRYFISTYESIPTIKVEELKLLNFEAN